MRKITRVVFILVGLIGITFISTAQAVQPYKHITYGDVTAQFQTCFVSAYLLNWKTGTLQAAPVEGKQGEIWFFGDYCVNDAHFLCMQAFFDVEDHETALEMWQYQKDGYAAIDFYIDGNYLGPSTLTALKRVFFDHPSFRDPGEEPTLWGKYGWWFNTGHVFKPDEIPVGLHTLRLVIWATDPFGNIMVIIDWTAGFNIHECGH
ncbi:MAG: hypothetical protein FK732_00480 [Asgard group archaeon]|nr:hypothetical protein [Asgard group archaeon]